MNKHCSLQNVESSIFAQKELETRMMRVQSEEIKKKNMHFLTGPVGGRSK